MSGILQECGPSLTVALGSSVAVSFSYVCMLYLPFNVGDRNQPRIIAFRQLSAFALAIVCEGGLVLSVTRRDSLAANSPVSFFDHANAVAASSILTLLLYSGVLLASFDTINPVHNIFDELRTPQQRWISFRNYLASPVLEEVVFRRQALILWQCAPTALRVVCPAVLFGGAHLHHAAANGVAPAIFQFSYTSLFGMYAALLYLHSGTIVAPITAHITCNYLGIPDFAAITRHESAKALYVAYVMALVTFGFSLARGASLYASVYKNI